MVGNIHRAIAGDTVLLLVRFFIALLVLLVILCLKVKIRIAKLIV